MTDSTALDGAEPAGQVSGTGGPPTGRGDRLTRLLGWGVGITALLVAIAGLYAVWFVVVDPPAPRTFEERRLSLLRDISEEQSRSAEVWADYAAILIDTSQYAQAEAVIAKAKVQTDEDPMVLAAEAQLLAARGKHDEAVKVADAAIEKAIAARDKTVEDLAERGVVMAEKDIPAPAVITAALVKATIAEQREDWQVAVQAMDIALAQNPNMADVLVARGDAYAALGDKKAAEADYRAALVFVDDLKGAIDGLKRIGVNR